MSTFLIDWENIQDLRYTTPLSIFIYNRVHSVKSWADSWYQTCLLSEEKFGDISSFKINGRTRDMFSNDPINLIKPRRLKQSGYVELNYSAILSAKRPAKARRLIKLFHDPQLIKFNIITQQRWL